MNTSTPEPQLDLLVIEDMEEDRYIIQKLIGDLYALEFAVTPKQAMVKLLAKPYPVIILDLHLNDLMSGIELASFLRKRSKNHESIVIAVTSYGKHFAKERALEAGCDHYLHKPLDRQSLLEAIRQPGS